MKASELIKALQVAKAQYGDLEVWGSDFQVSGVKMIGDKENACLAIMENDLES